VSKLIVDGLSVSLDGYVAGPLQDESNPLGVGGTKLHEWIFATKSGREMIGQAGGSEGVDDGYFRPGSDGVGATIMGRNMFGPIRGSWVGSDWRGWWGESPPFHHAVFVLTHFARAPLTLDDTTFYFVTEGIDVAVSRAREAAGNGDVNLGGGAQTIREFLDVGLVDELNLAVVPISLGSGERLIEMVGEWPRGYECRSVVEGEGATHYQLVRS
jgi:dihydrofolate reductase